MSELVTGDAVVLGLRPAKLPSRALAVLIDLVLVWAVYLSLSFVLLGAAVALDDAAVAAVQVGLLLLVPVGGVIAIETLSQGRSLGKLMCGLRVVREDGGPIRFRHALVRGALGFVEIQVTFGVIASIASLVSARGRRLGDVFAGTLVVRERVPVARPTTLRAPEPWLVERFAALDLSRVPDALWLAVREYLMRVDQLDPGVRRSMAERLALDVAAHTGAPPPADLPAETYLAGVVAKRQERDTVRARPAWYGEEGQPGPVVPVASSSAVTGGEHGTGTGDGRSGGPAGHGWAVPGGGPAGPEQRTPWEADAPGAPSGARGTGGRREPGVLDGQGRAEADGTAGAGEGRRTGFTPPG